MPLTPGTRIGPYEITTQIGVGGMGEVYRATDTQLKRSVAIKVLPDAVSTDPERLARFQREAEVLASLNHPNIAQIYGIERSAGQASALVMELVEGPTLAERIAGSPIALDEALAIARQIVESLEAAHEQGIVHRDLKPANVKVREDGTVKVLDFGLAKALEPATASRAISPSSMTLSPTITTPAPFDYRSGRPEQGRGPMTQVGFILGSAAYMSPEQARGRTVDRRTDIWAFGCVLFEMLTGTRAFDADDVSLTLARVLERDVDLAALPAAVPPRVRQIIALCLRKDVRQRVQSIGDVRLALDGVFETAPPATTSAPATPRPLWQRLAPWAAAVAVAAAAIAFVALRPDPPPQVTRFQIHAPPGSTLPLGTPAISPDQRTIVYTVTDGQGVTRLHVRPLDRVETRALPGTENSIHPFWFPDGRTIAFASAPGNFLKQIDVGAGSPRTLFNVQGPWHGTVNQDGTLLFPAAAGIQRWSSGQSAATALNRREGETQAFPFFLADGKRYLVFVTTSQGTSVQLATLGSEERSPVVDADGAALIARTPPGKSYLLFVRNGDLLAQEIDETAGVVRGPTKVLVTNIGLVANPPLRPTVDVSTGVLAYQTGGVAAATSLTWVNRSGVEVGKLTAEASVGAPRLSPDGGRVLGTKFDSGASRLWVTDLRRGSSQQITFAGSAFDGIWSPDGTRVAFRSNDPFGVLVINADGSGERRITDAVFRLFDWSPDGQTLLAALSTGLALIRLDAAQKPLVVQLPRGRARDAMFSPNGNYIALTSNETGRDEVYVQATPPATFRTKISLNGGVLPRWRPDGKELFFISAEDGGSMMAVDVDTGASFSAGIPRQSFKMGTGPNTSGFAVRPDGQQFLLSGRYEQSATWPITVVMNWWAELE